MLAKDEAGRDVLVGLTHEETELYLAYSYRDDLIGKPFESEAAEQEAERRYLDLDDKHEQTRREILAAESEARRTLVRH